MASTRRIYLTYTPQGTVPLAASTGFRFTVVAAQGNLMANEVFKMVRQPITNSNLYQGVCTPSDLTTLPINDPPSGDPAGAFRLAALDITKNTEALALEVWNGIVSDVGVLKNNLDAQDVLVVATNVWIGAPP